MTYDHTHRLRLLHSLSLLLPAIANGYKFSINAAPTQCGNFTASWDGGEPPYELLLVPVGHVTPEIRTIVDQKVASGSSTSLKLKFPTGSQFVASLSDKSGVGAGGTSDVFTVGDGPSGRLTGPTQAQWVLYMADNPPAQCSATRISWDASANGPVSIWGAIPGGDTFDMGAPSSGTGFDWTPDVRSGTQMLIVAGDSQGRGTGGSSDLFAIGGGSGGCLRDNSPSTTSGAAAGQVAAASQTGDSSAPSSTSGSGSGSNDGSSGGNEDGDKDNDEGTSSGSHSDPNSASQQTDGAGGSSKHHVPVAGIVVGALGGVLLVLLALFFLLRSRTRSAAPAASDSSFGSMRSRGDLLASRPPSMAGSLGVDSVRAQAPHENLPRIYETEPFVMLPRGGAVPADLHHAHSGCSADESDGASTRESIRGLLAPSPLATPAAEKSAYLTGAYLNPFAHPLDATALPSPAPSHSPPSFRTVATGGETTLSEHDHEGEGHVRPHPSMRRSAPRLHLMPHAGVSSSTLGEIGEAPPTYDSWRTNSSSDAGHLAGHQAALSLGVSGKSSSTGTK
ncbi:hypothetical protein AURDEDRAFT_185413 [Auricularia subglabra TFB-10046 SS5]|nr:hypothetical protein AURDEDRAFT_185413 [Auricularia subglabra TFB-10046 SS5]